MDQYTCLIQRIQKTIFASLCFLIIPSITTFPMQSSTKTSVEKQSELLRIYTEELQISSPEATSFIHAMSSFLQQLRYPMQNTTDIKNYLFRALQMGAYPARGSTAIRQHFFNDKLDSFVKRLGRYRLYYAQAEEFAFTTLVDFYSTLRFQT